VLSGIGGVSTNDGLIRLARTTAAGSFSLRSGDTPDLISIDAATGTLGAWRPDVQSVFAVAAHAGAVYAGGAFTAFAGRAAGGLATLTPVPAPLRGPAIGGTGTLACDPGVWDGAPLLATA
jgi:hypothetical protein